jgi:hypothetical protein
MNTRFIIPLLFAGALAFACGPRSHSEPALATARSPRVTVSPVKTTKTTERQRRANGTPVQPRIDSKLAVAVKRNEVRFALNVENVGQKHVELSFPSGKAYDFVVVDSAGHEVWHWSQGRMFTQGVQNKQLGTGDAMTVAEAWKNPASSGRYTAIATLNSSNYPVEQRVDFVVP